MCAETVLYLLILLLTCVRKTNCFLPNKKKRFVKVDNRGLCVYWLFLVC